MKKNKLVMPFVKWVGGKRQIMDDIKLLLPKDIHKYTNVEPFIGGGAVLFDIQPKKAIINDFNTDLINVYNVIRDNVEDLLADLETHKNESDYFYELRGLDRSGNFEDLTPIKRASRFIFLNKTCYNGLYRVNNSGEFNSPFGRYKNPNIINQPVLKAVSKYLNNSNIEVRSGDYNKVLETLDEKSFVYLDPPYHPLTSSSNFTGYIQGGWSDVDQIRLKKACDHLNNRGIKFLLSNSSADFIAELYKDYKQTLVKAARSINSKADKRGAINEVLIRNYE